VFLQDSRADAFRNVEMSFQKKSFLFSLF
jgi:hypothetical protein